MNIEQYSKKLLTQYGYTNWVIDFDSSNAFAGKTIFADCVIVFAQKLQNMPEHVIKDVLIHEIAHVRAGQLVESHGKYWKSLAISMGGTGNRRITVTIIIFMKVEKNERNTYRSTRIFFVPGV